MGGSCSCDLSLLGVGVKEKEGHSELKFEVKTGRPRAASVMYPYRTGPYGESGRGARARGGGTVSRPSGLSPLDSGPALRGVRAAFAAP